jgi:hypothetical protein
LQLCSPFALAGGAEILLPPMRTETLLNCVILMTKNKYLSQPNLFRRILCKDTSAFRDGTTRCRGNRDKIVFSGHEHTNLSISVTIKR